MVGWPLPVSSSIVSSSFYALSVTVPQPTIHQRMGVFGFGACVRATNDDDGLLAHIYHINSSIGSSMRNGLLCEVLCYRMLYQRTFFHSM